MNEPVICPACGYENDATRVFCHSCGVRLPRTEEELEKKAEHNRQATEQAKKVLREGVKKSTKRSLKDLLAGMVHALITMGFYAALAAAIILALRLPANFPQPAQPDPKLVEAGERQIANAAKPGFKGNITTSQDLINDYLSSKQILDSRTVFMVLKAEVQRLFVILDEEFFTFGLEFSLAGKPLVITTNYEVTGSPGALSLKILGGSIGRLPLHPIIFERVFKWYEPAAEALYNQLQILSEAESIVISPGTAKATWDRPPAPGPTAPPQGPEFSRPELPVSPSQIR
jgi:hypothetical protein